MKFTLFISFLFISLTTLAQELIELCAGETETVTYYSESIGDGSNIWTINGVSYIGNDLTYTFSESGTYNISVKRENGPCYVEESLQVAVKDCPEVTYWIPNCFTPDGNEFNQQFGPIMVNGFDIKGFKFIIFNRWGEIIWESNDPEGRWDGTYGGKICPDGVYSWILTFNTLGDDGKITDQGHLTIIR